MNVFLVRRRSPDWSGISRDFRGGKTIDRSRFVPEKPVDGFPADVGNLVDRWNARFRLDFFTFRSVLAALSCASVARVEGARRLTYEQIGTVPLLAAQEQAYFYFYDDDDFFAPYLLSSIVQNDDGSEPDALVSPMFRVGQPIVATVVRDGHTADWIWGVRKAPNFRYQTINYGIHSRRCMSLDELDLIQEHALASAHANHAGFRDLVLPAVLSASVKTPGSASALSRLFESDERCAQVFATFCDSLRVIDLPDRYDWIVKPAREIASLVESVYRGDDYEAFLARTS